MVSTGIFYALGSKERNPEARKYLDDKLDAIDKNKVRALEIDESTSNILNDIQIKLDNIDKKEKMLNSVLSVNENQKN